MSSPSVMENLNFALGVGGFIIGIFGVIYAWLVQPRKRLTYSRTGIRLIGVADSSLPKSVQVLHSGQRVATLTLSDVLIWNSGNQTILPTDVVDTNRLRLEVSSGAKILEVQEASATRDEISLKVEINPVDPSQLLIGFRFLDAKDGMRLRILHTDENTDLKVLGTITGIPSGIRYHGEYVTLKSQRDIVKWGKRGFVVLALLWLFQLFKPSIYAAFPVVLQVRRWMTNFHATWFQYPPEQVDYWALALLTLLMMSVVMILWNFGFRYPTAVVAKLANFESGVTTSQEGVGGHGKQ